MASDAVLSERPRARSGLAGSGLSLLSHSSVPTRSERRSVSTSADGDSLQAGVAWQLGRDRADEAERARRLDGEGIDQVTAAGLDVEVAAVRGRGQVDRPDVRWRRAHDGGHAVRSDGVAGQRVGPGVGTVEEASGGGHPTQSRFTIRGRGLLGDGAVGLHHIGGEGARPGL